MKRDKMNIVMMDFSGIYREERFWEGRDVSWVEVQDIPGTNCYCDGEAMEILRSRIAEFPASGIHFIDSGNYHYMSRIWLEKIEEPFRLLVFDNHTDMQPPAFGGLLSCGGWIASALLELENLKEVILVGPDEEAFFQVEEELREKVRFLSREELSEMWNDGEKEPVPGGKAGSADGNWAMERFIREISTDLPLYISVDKDILAPGEACTTWSQGDMTLTRLLVCMEEVLAHFAKDSGEIAGVDICGESDPGEECLANDSANEKLLNLLFGKNLFQEREGLHEE